MKKKKELCLTSYPVLCAYSHYFVNFTLSLIGLTLLLSELVEWATGGRRHFSAPPPSTPAKLRRCAGGITFSNYTRPAHNVCGNIKSFPLRSTVYNAVAGSLNDVETKKKDLWLKEKLVTWKNWDLSMITQKERDVVLLIQ